MTLLALLSSSVVFAQEGEDDIAKRLADLEAIIRQQQDAMETQREALEGTIRRQQEQLDRQYQLILDMQARQQAQAAALADRSAPESASELAATPAPTDEESRSGEDASVASLASQPSETTATAGEAASHVATAGRASSDVASAGQASTEVASAGQASTDGASAGQQAAEQELQRRVAAGDDVNAVDANATLYDPSNTVFDPSFLGAWHLPGRTSAMRIGGYVNLGLITSFDPVLISDRFIVGSIPPEGVPVEGAREGTDVTVKQSRLNFEVREQTQRGTLRAFIEGDFEGENESFRLRHAFGQYNKLLAGKTWSTFANVNVLPEEVDFEGVNGVVLQRQAQLRFSPEFGEDFSAIFSIEEPGTDVVNGTGTKGNWDLIASVDRLDLGEIGGWNYRLSAILRDLEGQQTGAMGAMGSDEVVSDDSATGWGITTSGRTVFGKDTDDDFLLWQLTYGEGVGRYLNDLSTVGGGDAVFDPNGELQPLPVLAAYVSYRKQWERKPWFFSDWPGIIRSNFTVSWIDIDNYEFQDGSDYNRTLRASANIIYFPTQNLRFGGELLWGERKNKDGSKGNASQVQVSARYNF